MLFRSVNATYRVYTAKDTYTDETIPSTATTLTGTVTPGNLAAGTYVVSGTATCAGDLTLTGDVDLILEDECLNPAEGYSRQKVCRDDPSRS